jgi:hypothetical protein
VYKDFQPGLCKSFAFLTISAPNPKILEVILEVHGKRPIRFNLHAAFDSLKHEGSDADEDARETVRVVEKSEFQSMMKSGQRVSDLHLLDYLA